MNSEEGSASVLKAARRRAVILGCFWLILCRACAQTNSQLPVKILHDITVSDPDLLKESNNLGLDDVYTL